ncbi:hypothetical protein ACLB2K_004752 [Fragaria x ananassa]
MNTDKDNAKKPAAATSASERKSTDVNLKVKSQKFRTMYFRMKRHTPLQKLVDVYTRKYDVYSFKHQSQAHCTPVWNERWG